MIRRSKSRTTINAGTCYCISFIIHQGSGSTLYIHRCRDRETSSRNSKHFVVAHWLTHRLSSTYPSSRDIGSTGQLQFGIIVIFRRSSSGGGGGVFLVVVVFVAAVVCRFVHQKAHQQEPQPRCNALPTVPQLSGKDQTVPPLHVHGRVQTFKVGTTAAVIQTTTIGKGNQKGPFRLVRVHVEFLAFFARDIVLDHVRFPVVQRQLSLRSLHFVVVLLVVFHNGRHHRVHGQLDGRGERRVFPTAQCLFRVGVGGVLSFAGLLRDGDNVIRFEDRQASVGDINPVLFRDGDPVRDFRIYTEKSVSP